MEVRAVNDCLFPVTSKDDFDSTPNSLGALIFWIEVTLLRVVSGGPNRLSILVNIVLLSTARMALTFSFVTLLSLCLALRNVYN